MVSVPLLILNLQTSITSVVCHFLSFFHWVITGQAHAEHVIIAQVSIAQPSTKNILLGLINVSSFKRVIFMDKMPQRKLD